MKRTLELLENAIAFAQAGDFEDAYATLERLKNPDPPVEFKYELAVDKLLDKLYSSAKDIVKLQKSNTILREAVSFYAKEGNDNGEKARAAWKESLRAEIE